MTEIQSMTPSEATLCKALLKYGHILEADNLPRFRGHQELCKNDPNVTIISVRAWSERNKQQFWLGVPLSRALVDDDSLQAKSATIRLILECVAGHDIQGPPPISSRFASELAYAKFRAKSEVMKE